MVPLLYVTHTLASFALEFLTTGKCELTLLSLFDQAITPIRSISYYTSEDKLEKITIGTGETGPRVLERESTFALPGSAREILTFGLTRVVEMTVLAELTGIQSGTRQDKNDWCWPKEGLDGSK